ncbi:MAG TPA: thioredoxin [Thermoguttaceae bacterium]|nr:thioredoxin [Thermoguttaceae bacterium]
MAHLPEFSDANFETEVLRATQPVLVDFWGPGCHPCKMIAPVIEELAAENSPQAKVGKLNVAESPSIAAEYGITGIPTLMIFKNGEVVARFMGAQPKARLQAALDEAME